MYALASDLELALGLLARGGARVMAGATDIYPQAGDRPLQGDFIDVSRLPALRGVRRDVDHIRIGAATTWSEIVAADLPPAFDALKAAAREVGAAQIQNRGTIGGNLCNASPAADGVPPLLIIDAEVELASARGTHRMPLDAFLLGNRRTALAPDEILTAVLAPAPKPTLRSAFLKLGARRYLVISIVMVAVALDIESGAVSDARIAIGACSATARRMPAAERRLVGAIARTGLGQRLAAADFAELSPIDDVRASGEYRRDAALILARRAIEACLRGETGGAL